MDAMANERISLSFPGVTRDQANKFASSLSGQLKDVDRSIRVETMKDRPDTMDFGTTLVLVLGTAAVTEVAKGIAQWMARHKTKVELTVGATKLTVSDSDPESVAKMFEALSSGR